VYGDSGATGGAFAEYVSVAADLVELKPTNLMFERAAAVPLAASPPSVACATWTARSRDSVS
jgi:NADPH:quinone reductase-like Zn-dependent oxidoreductase